MRMSFFLMIFLAFGLLRVVTGGGRAWRRRRWEQPSLMLEEKVAKLEALVAELQEQAELDRDAIHRLEEERDFLRQLYPAKEPARV
jgi:hypothetical protein